MQSGLAHLKRFVEQGGLLVTAGDSAKFAIDMGLAPGASVTPAKDLKVVGSVLNLDVVDEASPVVSGYAKSFSAYSPDGLSFKVSALVGGDDGLPNAKDYKRATGRGGPNDTDVVEGRAAISAPELPSAKPWQALPLNAEQMRNNPLLIPADRRPRALVRFADADDLLVSGLLQGGGALAEHAAVVDAPYGRGHTLLFAINPIWRGRPSAATRWCSMRS